MKTTSCPLRLWVAITTAICFASNNMFAVVNGMSANPEPLRYEQPDGTETPLIYLRGDEYYHWMEDTNGYTIIQDENNWYVYATTATSTAQRHIEATSNTVLISSGGRIGYVNPKKMGLLPHLALKHYVVNEQHANANDNHNDVADQYAHLEQSVEHRDLLNVPPNALCNFNGSKRDPCELRNLVILIRFQNHMGRKLPDAKDYDILFNNNGPTENDIAPTGSISDVFLENSYGKFKARSTVSHWIDVGRTEQETVDGRNGLNRPGSIETWKTALTIYENSRGKTKGMSYFDADNDGRIDAICLMHSGVAAEHGGKDCEAQQGFTGATAERVWSHATGGKIWTSQDGKSTNRYYVASGIWGRCPPKNANGQWPISRIAVIAHEMGHFLGLPDLYDGKGGQGVGRFDLQGQCWGWKRNQRYPPMLGAWSRYKLKWVKVTEITQSGAYTAGPACTSNEIFRIQDNMPNDEYFLIENRYGCGFDIELQPSKPERYRGGLAIWHIDETGKAGITHTTPGYPGDSVWPEKHYKVALKQCDGEFSLEKNKGQGDENDLCKYDPKGIYRKTDRQGYSIGPEGLTLNGDAGIIMPDTNTHSYSTGKLIPTQIRITAKEADREMQFIVSLRGESVTSPVKNRSIPPPPPPPPLKNRSIPPPPPPPPPPPTRAPTPRPTRRPPTKPPTPPPTRRPTKPPTPPPTRRPTKPPTPPPTRRPTKPPTPPPTRRPTKPPTRPPTKQPTRPPTKQATRSGQRTVGGKRSGGGVRTSDNNDNKKSGVRTSPRTGGSQKYSPRGGDDNSTRPGAGPQTGTRSGTRVRRGPDIAIPITCDNDPDTEISFNDGHGDETTSCSEITSMDLDRVCNLMDDNSQHPVYLTCQNECSQISKCNSSGSEGEE